MGKKLKLNVNNYEHACKLFQVKLQQSIDDWSSKYHQASLVAYFRAFSTVFANQVSEKIQTKIFDSLLSNNVIYLIGKLGTIGSFQRLYDAQFTFIYRLFESVRLENNSIPIQFQCFVKTCFSNILRDLEISSRYSSSFELLKVIFSLMNRYPKIFDSCYDMNALEITDLSCIQQMFPFFTIPLEIAFKYHDFELFKCLLRFLHNSPLMEHVFERTNIFKNTLVPIFLSEVQGSDNSMIIRFLRLLEDSTLLFKNQLLFAVFHSLNSVKLSNSSHYTILKNLILFDFTFDDFEQNLVALFDSHLIEWNKWVLEILLNVLKSTHKTLIHSQFCSNIHKTLDSSKVLTKSLKNGFLSFFFNSPSLNSMLLQGFETLERLNLLHDDDLKLMWNIHLRHASFLSRLVEHPESKSTYHLITFPETHEIKKLTYNASIIDVPMVIENGVIQRNICLLSKFQRYIL